MTIEEQITIFEHNAEHERKEGDLHNCLNFRQLAQWLKELKEYRKMPIDKACILKTLKELRQEFVEELESLQESHDWGRVYGMEIAIEMIDHKIEEVQNDD